MQSPATGVDDHCVVNAAIRVIADGQHVIHAATLLEALRAGGVARTSSPAPSVSGGASV
jgi:hypothetical protein